MREHLDDMFDDVVWSDEYTVQMECHRRFACHKRGEAPHPKPRYVNLVVLNTVLVFWLVPREPGCDETSFRSTYLLYKCMHVEHNL